MLRNASFYRPAGELNRAALLIRNSGRISSLEDGTKLADAFGARWLEESKKDGGEEGHWVPPSADDVDFGDLEAELSDDEEDEMTDSDEDSDSESESESGSSSSDSDAENGKPSGEEPVARDLSNTSPDDALARIHLRDAERTFAEPAHQQRLIKLLQQLSLDLNGEYHQALAAIVGLLLLVLDTDEQILQVTRHLLTPRYKLKDCLRAESIMTAVDGYLIHDLLPATFPVILSQLEKHGLLPETYYQRIRIAAGVGMLPFPALFESIDGLLEGGVRYLYLLTLSLFAHLKPKLEAAKNSSQMFILLHLDPEEWGAAGDNAEKRAEYNALCLRIVTTARALLSSSSTHTITGLPEEDVTALKAAAAALDVVEWNEASAAVYETRLRKRLERKWKDQKLAALRKEREEKKKAEKEAAKKAAKKEESNEEEQELEKKMAELNV